MIGAAKDYGPLKDIVALAGSIMAAGAAIALAFRGRARWEPSEQDIQAGAQKVGALVASVLIALMWVAWRDGKHNGTLVTVALVLLGATLLSLLLYGYLVGAQTYDVVTQDGTKKVIGGFWLTAEAKEQRKARNLTIQRLLEGAAYDVDKLWSRPSRQLAKSSFLLGYLGLTICGTVALAAAAIRLGIAVG